MVVGGPARTASVWCGASGGGALKARGELSGCRPSIDLWSFPELRCEIERGKIQLVDVHTWIHFVFLRPLDEEVFGIRRPDGGQEQILVPFEHGDDFGTGPIGVNQAYTIGRVCISAISERGVITEGDPLSGRGP